MAEKRDKMLLEMVEDIALKRNCKQLSVVTYTTKKLQMDFTEQSDMSSKGQGRQE